MKKITRYDEEDLCAMVMEKYDLRPEQVIAVHTTELRGYGMNEHDEPVFYIEVQEDG